MISLNNLSRTRLIKLDNERFSDVDQNIEFISRIIK